MKMRKIYSLMVMALLVLSVMPMAFAEETSTPITPDITTEDFPPLVWMCDNRIVLDDEWQPGTTDSSELKERQQNYAFAGESISWEVLVMDKNGINKIEDVFATVGSVQGEGNDIEVNCVPSSDSGIKDSCNARILEEEITEFNPLVMKYYTCTLTVETGGDEGSMYGEYWVTVEATDLDGEFGTMDENEYWFFNPIIALSIDDNLAFEDVRPGTSSYSDTIRVGNDADEGSGVRLEMFISGTNFFDSSSSGAMCPNSNVLDLNNFRYFATNGAYSTSRWVCGGGYVEDGDWCSDAEGYMQIPYGDDIKEAKEIMGTEIYGDDIADLNYGDASNILTPGSEMALTFRLDLPEPCNGDFDTGSIYFWGEAI
jgi:hypothetical protein